MNGPIDDRDKRSGRTAERLAYFAFAMIALYFLLTQHRAHLISALPYLLLAACPLMHVFHHRGGHGHRHGNKEGDETPPPATESRPERP
mgnify:CR=1 FL=1